MRKLAIAFLLATAGIFYTPAQSTDNMVYVKQFPGKDVGTKVTNAMASCNPNTSIVCILVIDPSLAVYSAGTMPAMCSHCILSDYRAGRPAELEYGKGGLNAMACGYGIPPQWCRTNAYGNMSNVADWINAAFKSCPLSTSFSGSTPFCRVYLDNLDGSSHPFQISSTIHIPSRGVLDCLEANINWNTGESVPGGVIVQYGSPAANHGVDLGGGIVNCRIGIQDITQGKSSLTTSFVPPTNNVIGATFGGDPGYNWHNYIDGVDQGPGTATTSDADGSSFIFDHNIIAGASVAVQGGNNFIKGLFSNSRFYHNYSVVNDSVLGTNSGEGIVFLNDFAWNQWGVSFILNNRYEYKCIACSIDYSNMAGLPNFENMAEVRGNRMRWASEAGHFEHESGPVLYIKNTSGLNYSSFISLTGTRLAIFQTSNSAATSSNCHIDGPYTVMGNTWNKATITAANTFSGGDSVTAAAFAGQCSSLNGGGNLYAVNTLDLSPTSFWFYVPNTIPVTTVDDTSAGTLTVPTTYPIVANNSTPPASTPDYIGGNADLQGNNRAPGIVDISNDSTAKVDIQLVADVAGYTFPHLKESTTIPVQIGPVNISGCTHSGEVGGKTAGTFTAGQTNCTVVITPGTVTKNGFHCKADDLTSGAALRESATTNFSCTVTGTVAIGDTIVYSILAAF